MCSSTCSSSGESWEVHERRRTTIAEPSYRKTKLSDRHLALISRIQSWRMPKVYLSDRRALCNITSPPGITLTCTTCYFNSNTASTCAFLRYRHDVVLCRASLPRPRPRHGIVRQRPVGMPYHTFHGSTPNQGDDIVQTRAWSHFSDTAIEESSKCLHQRTSFIQ